MSLVSSVVPIPTPESRPFWASLERGQPEIQRCGDCGNWYFPPAPICPKCLSQEVRWHPISGRATLYSYIIAQNPYQEWQTTGPMSVALVALEEGPKLTSTIVGCDQSPAALKTDMKLKAQICPMGDTSMLCFRPVRESER